LHLCDQPGNKLLALAGVHVFRRAFSAQRWQGPLKPRAKPLRSIKSSYNAGLFDHDLHLTDEFGKSDKPFTVLDG
jgi:hypothetical protein